MHTFSFISCVSTVFVSTNKIPTTQYTSPCHNACASLYLQQAGPTFGPRCCGTSVSMLQVSGSTRHLSLPIQLGRSTSTFRRCSSWLPHCQTPHSSWEPRKPSPDVCLRKTRIHPPPPDDLDRPGPNLGPPETRGQRPLQRCN